MTQERRVVRSKDVLDHRNLTIKLVTERDAAEREFTYVWGTGPAIAYCVPLFEDGTTTLLRQRRYGIDGPSLEVPGGHVAGDEQPAAAAARELEEEAGLVAGTVTPLTHTFLSVKIQQELHFHVATELSEGTPSPEADEEIETVRMPLEEAVAAALRGEVRHGPSVTALLLAARHAG
jgi:ADP-ribose pyrophosphatase